MYFHEHVRSRVSVKYEVNLQLNLKNLGKRDDTYLERFHKQHASLLAS